MGLVIGIDIGGSTTKIIGIKDKEIISPIQVRATDPIASLYGAFGKFLAENGIELQDVDKVFITGVGSSSVKEPIYGIKTFKVDEFLAVGNGGLYLSGFDSALVVSMGTGTAYIWADHDTVKHIGGTGVGGGTLLGISKMMLHIGNIDDIVSTAQSGDLSKIDLLISDITSEEMPTLNPNVTASNFGKISDLATKNDMALGIMNLVFQTIGMLAVFATKAVGSKNVVLTGFLATVPQSEMLFRQLEEMFGITFKTPDHAEFATAIGAALCNYKNYPLTEIK